MGSNKSKKDIIKYETSKLLDTLNVEKEIE